MVRLGMSMNTAARSFGNFSTLGGFICDADFKLFRVATLPTTFFWLPYRLSFWGLNIFLTIMTLAPSFTFRNTKRVECFTGSRCGWRR